MKEAQSPILYDPWYDTFISDPYTRFKPLYHQPPQLVESDKLPRSVRATTPAGAPVAMVARYEDVLTVMRDDARFGAARPASRKSGHGLGVFGAPPLVFTDPPVHTRLRRLMGRPFSPRRVRQMEPRIRAIAHELLGRIAVKARDGAAFDLMKEFANPLPTMVIAEMLGVPASDSNPSSCGLTRYRRPILFPRAHPSHDASLRRAMPCAPISPSKSKAIAANLPMT
jgi:cytochrome P450